jgi:DeoR family glycerol-3-phosphate regulon repressor
MSGDAVQDRALAPRQAELLRMVGQHGFGTVDGLARRFGVSTQTIRRDIIMLTSRGLLQRFHGGAGPVDTVRLGHAEKGERHRNAKARIAAMVAEEIPDGAAVFLDVGTTSEAVAAALAARPTLRVFTNNMQAALRLAGGEGPQVRVLGGTLRGADGSLVGGDAVWALGGIALDVAVIACSGFDAAAAPTDFDPEKIALKRAAIAAARRALLVTDASKFGQPALERIAPARSFVALVTDAPPGGEMAAALQRAGVALRVAGG